MGAFVIELMHSRVDATIQLATIQRAVTAQMGNSNSPIIVDVDHSGFSIDLE